MNGQPSRSMASAGVVVLVALAGAALDGPGAASAAGDTTPADTTPADTSPADPSTEVEYPVTAEYAGITWSVTALDDRVEEGGSTILLVDVDVTNNNPFGMSWPIEALTLRDADGGELIPDGQVGTGSRSIDVDALHTVDTTLEFEGEFKADRLPEPSELSLVIATTGHIPEIVPFAGEPPARAYPVAVTFTGATTPLGLDHSYDEQPDQEVEDVDTATITAVGGTVGIDAPGVRAPIGERLIVLDVLLEASSTNTGEINIDEDHYRLDVGGTTLAPVALIESVDNNPGFYPRVGPGLSETFTLVFEIPTDAAAAAVTVANDDGHDSDRLAIALPPLPTCCGE